MIVGTKGPSSIPVPGARAAVHAALQRAWPRKSLAVTYMQKVTNLQYNARSTRVMHLGGCQKTCEIVDAQNSSFRAMSSAAVQAALARKKRACVHIHSEVGARGLAHRGLRAAPALTLLAAASIASAVMLTVCAFVPCPRARRRLWTCSTASRYT